MQEMGLSECLKVILFSLTLHSVIHSLMYTVRHQVCQIIASLASPVHWQTCKMTWNDMVVKCMSRAASVVHTISE